MTYAKRAFPMLVNNKLDFVGRKFAGDLVTPHYSIMAETPLRIADFYGEGLLRSRGLRFLVLLREPVARTISSWEYKSDRKCIRPEFMGRWKIKQTRFKRSCHAPDKLFMVVYDFRHLPISHPQYTSPCSLQQHHGSCG